MQPHRKTNFIRAALGALLLLPFSATSLAQTVALAVESIAAEPASAVSYNTPHLVYKSNLQPITYTENDTQRALNSLKHDALIQNAALRSEIAFVQDLESATVLYQKNSDAVRPIASITKLMTALVVAESGQPMHEMLEIIDADVDRVKHSSSRLSVGSTLSRADMMHLALMSSENRAAHALGRNYPGGLTAFVRAMNDKARALGMRNTRFVEPTGLSSDNVSSPRDLVKLLAATSKQPRIQQYTTNDQYSVQLARGRQLTFNNTNRLVKNANWDIQVSKTGFINEAGECLVMLTKIEDREVAIVLLNSSGRYSRIGDAVRIRNLVEKSNGLAML